MEEEEENAAAANGPAVLPPPHFEKSDVDVEMEKVRRVSVFYKIELKSSVSGKWRKKINKVFRRTFQLFDCHWHAYNWTEDSYL